MVSKAHFEALEAYIAAASELGDNEAYLTDLALWAGFYAFGKADLLVNQINEAYLAGDNDKAAAMEVRFKDLMLRADRLLDKNPVTRMQRWIDFARGWGDSQQESDKYEKDCRRIVTTWGISYPDAGLNDYACKIWSGLIRDYYIPRWQHFFDAKKAGKPFDFAAWEGNFTEEKKLSDFVPVKDLVKESQELVNVAKDIEPAEGQGLSGWTSFEMRDSSTLIIRMMEPEDYIPVKALRFRWKSGEDNVTLKRVQVNAAGWVRSVKKDINVEIGKDNPVVEIPLEYKRDRTYQFIYVHIELAGTKLNGDSQVAIEYVK